MPDDLLQRTIGEMSASLRYTADAIQTQARAIESLSIEMRRNTSALASLESGLASANSDIVEIRASLVAPETLRKLGMDVDDYPASRADFEHLRASRMASEENKPLLAEAKKTVLTGLLAAALAWLGPTIVERIKADVSTPQPAAGKRQEKSE